jgi:uncharacterized protein (TIGR02117 family)
MIRRAALALAVLAALAAVAALLGAALPRPFLAAESEQDAGPLRRILIFANPIHTDIALPPDPDVLASFAFLREDGLPIDDPVVGWIAFGWGGRSFYLETPTWAELKPGPAFRALTLDRAVMHVALAGEVDPAQAGVLALDLTPAQFQRLVDNVLASFTRNAEGAVVPIEGRSYGPYDRFYEANGWFNALVGCNVWTASTLRSAGLRTGWWNPLPLSLLWSVETYNPV